MNKRKGSVIWLMGMSGSGKTTVAKAVVGKLRARGVTVVHLDGDDLRDSLQQRSNYGHDERVQLALSYARLSKLISDQGFVVVVSSIGLYRRLQDWLRQHVECYVEVFLDAPFDLLVSRDLRGIYSADILECGQVVGQDFPSENPLKPDLHILLNEFTTVDHCMDEVVKVHDSSLLDM